jgi:hypothetical protein
MVDGLCIFFMITEKSSTKSAYSSFILFLSNMLLIFYFIMSIKSGKRYLESVKNAFPKVYGHLPNGASTVSTILYSFLNIKSSSTKWGIITSNIYVILISSSFFNCSVKFIRDCIKFFDF